jgi:hypothetical protein
LYPDNNDFSSLKKQVMPQVQPGKTFKIPDGTSSISVTNDSTTSDGKCNVFTGSGSQNVTLTPGQTKNVQLDGGDDSSLDNVGNTVLTVS